MKIMYKVWAGDSLPDRDLYQSERDLRRLRLRSHLGPDTDVEIFPGEDTSQTMHVSAIYHDRIIGCCLFKLSDLERLTGRLFQMAVHADHVGNGIGTGLVHTLEKYLSNEYDGEVRIELHAREDAIGFYKKLGYNIIPNTEPFIEIGNITL